MFFVFSKCAIVCDGVQAQRGEGADRSARGIYGGGVARRGGLGAT